MFASHPGRTVVLFDLKLKVRQLPVEKSVDGGMVIPEYFPIGGDPVSGPLYYE